MVVRPVASTNRRSGFALFAAVVTVVVLAVLATIVTKALSGGNDADRIAMVADVLKRFEVEIINPTGPAFKINTGANPGRLSHLFRHITGADRNSCGALYTTSGGTNNVGNQRGPYHLVPYPTNGPFIISPGFVANDVLVRNPNSSSAGTLAVVMDNVTLGDAKLLGRQVDGRVDGLGPYVRFALTDPTSVSYLIQVTGC
jgi:hypothetical protein